MAERKDEEKKYDREALLLEKKKVVFNLVLLLAASFVVLVGVLTMAWFASNTNVGGQSLSVSAETPEGVQISLGETSNGLLVQYGNVPVDDGDWMTKVEISDYYKFGKLFPASSANGEHILFTPDSIGNGRYLKNERYYVADSGKTDGDLKHDIQNDFVASNDTDSLMATVHLIGNNDSWVATDGSSWYDTNDDGYYVDIPVWFRTNITSGTNGMISLNVKGFVEPGDNAEAGDTLYQAVRVAILDANYAKAVSNNILPLKADAYSTDTTGMDQGVLDSLNYTRYRDTNDGITDSLLYGMKISGTWDGSLKPDADLQQYTWYNLTTPIISVPVSDGSGWSNGVKYVIRVWLDGEDEQCYNPTAGQNWKIHLTFSRPQ